MHHQLKYQCHGLPVIMAPIVLYSDDTSGNRSKKWNKFDCWCLSMAGLPIKLARQFSNIHLLAFSNKVSAFNMTNALVKELLVLEKGITVYDDFLKHDIYLLAPVMCILADNARSSELLNHLGATAIKYCRMCMVNIVYS